jgi:hypothetical protein
LEKIISPAADFLTFQIFKGEQFSIAVDRDTIKNYFLDSPELAKKRVMQALWETVQSYIFEEGVSADFHNNICLNRIYKFNKFPEIRMEDRTGISDLLSSSDLVGYYNANVGKVKILRKSKDITHHYAETSVLEKLYLTRSAFIIFRNLMGGKSILDDIKPLSESDYTLIFSELWRATKTLLESVPDDDGFMFKLILNRINRFLLQPELKNACRADLGDFCSLRNFEDVKRYHSANKKPPIASIEGKMPGELFAEIKNCYGSLKRGGLNKEEAAQIEGKLKSKIKSVLDYYSGTIRIFSEEIYKILEEECNEESATTDR